MIGDDKEDLLVKSESVKNLLGKTQESRGALAFLRSRETQLGVLSMVLLVFQGTALSLVLRYSRYALASVIDADLECLDLPLLVSDVVLSKAGGLFMSKNSDCHGSLKDLVIVWHILSLKAVETKSIRTEGLQNQEMQKPAFWLGC